MIVQLFSDYACPYCYLSEFALRIAAPRAGVEVVYRAFQLRGERIDAGWRDSVLPLAERMGAEIRRPSRPSEAQPDTRLAHEAAAWARTKGLFDRFHRAIFRAYFIDDLDPGEISVLKGIAFEIGLNPAELETVLEERKMADEIDEDLLIAETYGVKTLPTMVVAGHLIGGVQDQENLTRIFELARAGKLDEEARKLPHAPVRIES